jgi:hypothetical protein
LREPGRRLRAMHPKLQREPQSVFGEAHVHAPPEQISFCRHTIPQPPQFLGSLEGFVHANPAMQLSCPVEQGLIVVEVVVVTVVVVGPASGAHRSGAVFGVTVRLPN